MGGWGGGDEVDYLDPPLLFLCTIYNVYITTSNYYDLILDIFIVIVIKVFFLERNLSIYDIKGKGDYILFKIKTRAVTLIIKHGFDIFVVMLIFIAGRLGIKTSIKISSTSY